MNEPRDTIVGDALRRLDIPDHAPDFWARLDADLASGPPVDDHEAGQHGGAEDDSAEVIELGTARQARRSGPRPSTRWPAVAAAAAAVAAIALGVGLPALQQAADGESQVDMADTTPDPAPDAMQPAPESIPDTTAPETIPVDPAVTQLAAEELAGEWLTRLRAGEVEAAHSMLDGPSQERLSLEDLRQESTALAEGAGAFAGDGVTSTTVVVEPADGPVARIVTFAGDVQREGMIETAAYPVVVTGDDPDSLGIAFVLDGPTIELEQLSSPTETRTSPVRMTTSEAAEVWASVDGSEPESSTGGPAIIDVEAAAGAGTHIVTIVAREGSVYTATATTVVVP